MVRGGVIDVYPLAIPSGEGLSIPVKLLGEVGFYSYRGALMLVVPPALADVVKAQFASELAAGTSMAPGFRAGLTGATVAEFAVALRPGMRKAIPLGARGELGVEVA